LLRALVDVTVIFPDDNSVSHEGGSYMYAGRYVHDLLKFHKLNSTEKSHIIGRDYTKVCPHTGYDTRPENPRLDNTESSAHTARGHGIVYRQAYPYVQEEESGLFFCAFSRSLMEIDRALKRMAGHEASDGSVDNLFKITKSVANNYYYVPSLLELKDLAEEEQKQLHFLTPAQMNNNNAEEKKTEEKKKKIFIEYCTNCGYRTIYLDMKNALEANFHVEVIGNPKMPRLAAFEVTTEDGAVLWSKLAQPDGMNNFPRVFPTTDGVIKAYQDNGGISKEKDIVTPAKAAIYKEGTRVGIW